MMNRRRMTLILVFNRKKTTIIEDDFCKTRRRTPLGWRLARTTTKYCRNQSDKNVWFLMKTSIKSSNSIRIRNNSRKPAQENSCAGFCHAFAISICLCQVLIACSCRKVIIGSSSCALSHFSSTPKYSCRSSSKMMIGG